MPVQRKPNVPRGAAAALLLAALLAGGCGWSRPELIVLVPADVTGLLPEGRDESFTMAVNANIFEGLVRFDRQLRVEPAVARSWESPDDRTWLFEIRPGLRFSDGTPVRAADVVASLDFARGPGSATRAALSVIESVDVPAEGRVRIRTHTPYPVLLPQLAGAFVLPAAVFARPPVRALGTGAWRVESHVRGRELVLVPNPVFRDGPPPWSRVRFAVEPDGAARVRAVVERRAQVADAVPLGELPALRGRKDVRLVSRPGLRVLFIALRVDEPPFADPRVREALDLALDREELVRRALDGAGAPASQLVPPAVVGYNPDLTPTRPDRERARRLLREAGQERLSFRLDGPSNRYPGDVGILNEVARQLGEVGVHAEVRARPKEEFFAALSGKMQAYLLGWSCEPLHAGDALESLIHTPGPSGVGFENSNGLSDPDLDRLIEEADRTASLNDRIRLLGEALASVARKRPVLPLVIQVESTLLAPDVPWDPPMDGALRLYTADRRVP